jgi:hypothetical protein
VTYVFLFLLQSAFTVLLFLYFRNKFYKAVSLEKGKNEIENLITTFNRYADRNLSMFEERLNEYKELHVEFDNKLKIYHKLKLYKLEEKAVKKPDKSTTLPRKKKPQRRDTRIVSYLSEITKAEHDKQFDSFSPKEKIDFLIENNFSDTMIAKKLDMSIDEIKLIRRTPV